VTLGGSQGDRVAVIAGLKSGDEIVTAGVFRLQDGGKVMVNNSIQPENEAAPAPADS
jgi:membrane fusion protein (multidrug efflux system)